MKLSTLNMRSTAIAALLSLPLASGAAFAQETQDTDQTDQTTTQSQDTAQQQQDTVVATVGGTEILGADVLTVIGMLPPELQSQPPQMLVPMALEQLILRELILQDARGQGLASDPEVVGLVDGATMAAEDDALVQVWIDRETANRVTDEGVQQVYDQALAQGQQDLPPLEEVRPQIEQFLRQGAMQEIRVQLLEGADVVFFDPTGQPVEQQAGGTQSNDGAAETTQSTDGAAESSDSAEPETQDN